MALSIQFILRKDRGTPPDTQDNSIEASPDERPIKNILRELDDGRSMSKRRQVQQIHRDQAAVTDQIWRAGNTLCFSKLHIKLDPANDCDFFGVFFPEPFCRSEPLT